MTTAEYNACVDEHSDNVFRFILKNIKDEDKAKDIVQESFTKMWVKVEEIDYKKSRSYLFSTAYHTMIDMIRKDKKQGEMNEKAYNEYSSDRHYSDASEILSKAVELLPEIQKNVLLLRDYEGYSYDEIGEITNLNASQVKVYIFRARKFLKNYIGSLDKVI